MTDRRTEKKLARRLAKAKGRRYQGALNELRGLPEGTSWREYVERVERQKADGTLIDGGKEKRS